MVMNGGSCSLKYITAPSLEVVINKKGALLYEGSLFVSVGILSWINGSRRKRVFTLHQEHYREVATAYI